RSAAGFGIWFGAGVVARWTTTRVSVAGRHRSGDGRWHTCRRVDALDRRRVGWPPGAAHDARTSARRVVRSDLVTRRAPRVLLRESLSRFGRGSPVDLVGRPCLARDVYRRILAAVDALYVRLGERRSIDLRRARYRIAVAAPSRSQNGHGFRQARADRSRRHGTGSTATRSLGRRPPLRLDRHET